tara:strand:+ start:1543 stop:2160 length:618 start_codon:yes stop_codon:yes gene_type:complete
MGALGAVIGALLAGFIGSAAWALLILKANYEIGWLAWGIGGLVGLGALIGSGRKISPMNGVLAAVIAVLSVFGGKFAAIHHQVTDVSDEFATSMFADIVAEEFMDEGRNFDWPPAGEDDIREDEEHYPAEVWAEGVSRWDSLGSDGQAGYKTSLRENAMEFTGQSETEMVMSAIKDNLDLFDLLFIGLAIATAFRIGSGMMGGEE